MDWLMLLTSVHTSSKEDAITLSELITNYNYIGDNE